VVPLVEEFIPAMSLCTVGDVEAAAYQTGLVSTFFALRAVLAGTLSGGPTLFGDLAASAYG
jgi:hypothetical protein